MKVLHLGKFDRFGGIERHVRLLLTGLTQTGEAVTVNLVSNDDATTNQDMRYGYKTVRAACWGTVASVALTPSLPYLARRLHAEHQFDVVHLHFPDPLGQLTASLLPHSVARVVSWHSDIVRQRLGLALYRPFLAHFLGTVDTIIAATPYHFTSSTQIPPAAQGPRRAVIPYAFEPERWRATPASLRHLDELQREKGVRPAVFALGRHVYYKGFEYLIRAMAQIDATLLLIGDGPLRHSLEKLAQEAGVASRVEFLGEMQPRDIVPYYHAADLFVLPSIARSEAFGIVQLEAMACGKPVVNTSLASGVPFASRDGLTGITVAPESADALAAAINRLLADQQLRIAYGEAARRRVQSEFTINVMVNRTRDLYEAVLNRKDANIDSSRVPDSLRRADARSR